MKNRLNHILVIIVLFFATSCSSVYFLQVQIGYPGKEELNPEIQSLTLINRATDSRFHNSDSDTLQQIFYKNKFNLDTVIYDITASDTLLKALGELIYESGRYDIVIPENRFIAHTRNSFFSDEMPWSEVEELCKVFNTDAVMSLDHFKTSISTTYDSETMYDRLDGRYFKAYVAVIAIQYEALIRVYDPVKQKIIKSTFLKDTLLWEDADLTSRVLFNRMTSVKEALNETGIAVALDYADRISTQWKTGTRKYYSKGNYQFEKAHELVKANDWENAIEIWLESANNATGRSVRSKSEYNIALGYEMIGNIQEAIKWGLKSYETKYYPLTVEYLNILKTRRAELKNQ